MTTCLWHSSDTSWELMNSRQLLMPQSVTGVLVIHTIIFWALQTEIKTNFLFCWINSRLSCDSFALIYLLKLDFTAATEWRDICRTSAFSVLTLCWTSKKMFLQFDYKDRRSIWMLERSRCFSYPAGSTKTMQRRLFVWEASLSYYVWMSLYWFNLERVVSALFFRWKEVWGFSLFRDWDEKRSILSLSPSADKTWTFW